MFVKTSERELHRVKKNHVPSPYIGVLVLVLAPLAGYALAADAKEREEASPR